MQTQTAKGQDSYEFRCFLLEQEYGWGLQMWSSVAMPSDLHMWQVNNEHMTMPVIVVSI